MMDGCAGTPRGAGQSQPGQDWEVKARLSHWVAFPTPSWGPSLSARPSARAPVSCCPGAAVVAFACVTWMAGPGSQHQEPRPTLVWPGSRSPGAHVIGVGASSFLVFTRTKGSGTDWEWFSQGLPIPPSDS